MVLRGSSNMTAYGDFFVFYYMRNLKDVQNFLIKALTLELKPLTLLHLSHLLLSTL